MMPCDPIYEERMAKSFLHDKFVERQPEQSSLLVYGGLDVGLLCFVLQGYRELLKLLNGGSEAIGVWWLPDT